MLPFTELGEMNFGLCIPSNLGMSQMFARHEHAPRGGTNRSSAVMLREAHAFARQSIDVGCEQFFLSVATEFTPAQIVGQDENNVRLVCLHSHRDRLLLGRG